MNKPIKWVTHSASFTDWVESLKSLANHVWLQPIFPGKWSVGEIISHFITWDRYKLEERLPFMKQDARLIGIDPARAEEMNQQASIYARSGIAKEDLIDEFVSIRRALVSQLNKMTPDELQARFMINNTELTPETFFNQFIEHDLHHKQQIDTALK